jgi:hypothetical protein
MALNEIPEEFRAGQTFDVILSLVAYPADVWTSTLKFRPLNASIPDVPGVPAADGLSHQFTVDESVTVNWPAAYYTYLVEVTDGTDVVIAEEGSIEILAAPDNISGDQRSHAQIVLSNIEAVLEQKATKDQLKYMLHDRSLERYSFEELINLRTRYRNEVAREQRGGVIIQRQGIRFEN